ncbi:MAG: sensor histidine kinase, partial [Bacteroidota bacterium]
SLLHLAVVGHQCADWTGIDCKTNNTHLAFDDRWMMLIGIPFIALVLPFLFFGVDVDTFVRNFPQEYIDSLVYCTVYWMFNRFLMIVMRKKVPEFTQTLKRLLLQLVVIAVCVPIISTSISLFTHAIYQLTETRDLLQPTLLQGLGSTYMLTFAVLMMYESIYFFSKYKEAIVEKEKLQLAQIEGQLENLRNQINPHFLFNSLNTLMNLILTDQDRAVGYLDKLSKFYRYAVSNQDWQLTPVKTEMENVRLFIALLKERFQEGIQFSISDQSTEAVQIFPLCLQLLIENAVKHNIVSRRKPLRIDIETDNEYVTVRNTIQKRIHKVKSTGMGLKNISKRIALVTDRSVHIHEDNDIFEVKIPLII